MRATLVSNAEPTRLPTSASRHCPSPLLGVPEGRKGLSSSKDTDFSWSCVPGHASLPRGNSYPKANQSGVQTSSLSLRAANRFSATSTESHHSSILLSSLPFRCRSQEHSPAEHSPVDLLPGYLHLGVSLLENLVYDSC